MTHEAIRDSDRALELAPATTNLIESMERCGFVVAPASTVAAAN